MRTAFATVVLFGAAALATAQPPKDAPEPTGTAKDGARYGIKPRTKQYPQTAPKEALKSVIAAVETADFSYLVAHLLDPKFVDAEVSVRAKLLEPAAEVELIKLRDYQRANPDRVAPEDRISADPRGLRALAVARARDLGFKQLTRDVEQKLSDDPPAVRELRRFARDGVFATADPTATATHPEIKGRSLYFNKVGERWYLENRQAEEPKKEP